MTQRKKTVIVTQAYDADEYVPMAVAAAITSRSHRTLYRWVDKDEPQVRGILRDGRWYFRVEDLLKHIRQDHIVSDDGGVFQVDSKPIRVHAWR